MKIFWWQGGVHLEPETASEALVLERLFVIDHSPWPGVGAGAGKQRAAGPSGAAGLGRPAQGGVPEHPLPPAGVIGIAGTPLVSQAGDCLGARDVLVRGLESQGISPVDTGGDSAGGADLWFSIHGTEYCAHLKRSGREPRLAHLDQHQN